MFDTETTREIAAVAAEFALEPALLLAVADVESGGKAFALVAGRREPLIRFEGHYFDKRLTGARREAARKAGLASPLAGDVANPRQQAARWALVERAAAIDRKAAYESVSWGIGQVMGAHWAWLGHGSVEALAAEARSGVQGQVRLMARYIVKAGLAAALRRRDWEAFARGYNGPAYKRLGYDRKLKAAYARHAKAAQTTTPAASLLADIPATPGVRGAPDVRMAAEAPSNWLAVLYARLRAALRSGVGAGRPAYSKRATERNSTALPEKRLASISAAPLWKPIV